MKPTVRDVIKSLGGVPMVARHTGLTQPAVWYWIRTNRIPDRWVASIRDMEAARRAVRVA